MRESALLFVAVSLNVWAGTPLTAEQLRTRELAAAVADVTAKQERACPRLHDALTPYWRAGDRTFHRSPPSAVTGLRAAADACAAAAIAADEKAEWSVSRLLISPVLQDESLRKKALERNGGPPAITRGGGTGDYGGSPSPKRDCIDPTTANASTSGLDAELVSQVIRRNRSQVMHCYESQLHRVRGRSGKVLARFEITAEGKTSAIVMEESTLNDAAVEACVLERIATWVFPRPKKGVATVSYPFELGPADP